MRRTCATSTARRIADLAGWCFLASTFLCVAVFWACAVMGMMYLAGEMAVSESTRSVLLRSLILLAFCWYGLLISWSISEYFAEKAERKNGTV